MKTLALLGAAFALSMPIGFFTVRLIIVRKAYLDAETQLWTLIRELRDILRNLDRSIEASECSPFENEFQDYKDQITDAIDAALAAEYGGKA